MRRTLLSSDQVRTLIRHNQDLVLELAQSAVTKSDIVAVGYRRSQLERFKGCNYTISYVSRLRQQTKGEE